VNRTGYNGTEPF